MHKTIKFYVRAIGKISDKNSKRFDKMTFSVAFALFFRMIDGLLRYGAVRYGTVR
jgi:hypothetical protein